MRKHHRHTLTQVLLAHVQYQFFNDNLIKTPEIVESRRGHLGEKRRPASLSDTRHKKEEKNLCIVCNRIRSIGISLWYGLPRISSVSQYYVILIRNSAHVNPMPPYLFNRITLYTDTSDLDISTPRTQHFSTPYSKSP